MGLSTLDVDEGSNQERGVHRCEYGLGVEAVALLDQRDDSFSFCSEFFGRRVDDVAPLLALILEFDDDLPRVPGFL